MRADDLGPADRPEPQLLACAASSAGVGVPLHRLAGSPDDPTLLLLAHATGLHGRAYLPLARALEGCEVIAPDLRGHGDAGSPQPLEYTWSGFGDDVVAALDACLELGLLSPRRRLVGCGHSMGGASLVMAELRRPGTFRGLYLFEPIVLPTPSGPTPASPLVERARRRRSTFPSLRAAYDNYAAKQPLDALAPESLRAYVRYGFAPATDGSVRLKCRGEEEAEIYRMSTEHRTFERLGEIACPVRVAHGSRSVSPAAPWAEKVAERLSRGTREELPQLGHFGPLEDPAAVATSLRRFLDSL